jgi:hypothetical protein
LVAGGFPARAEPRQAIDAAGEIIDQEGKGQGQRFMAASNRLLQNGAVVSSSLP